MKLTTLAAAVCAAMTMAAAPAFAGECPADQVRPHTELNGPTMPSKVTDTVISSIDLGGQYNAPGRTFRMRRLEIKPGGVVPMHSHADRPAHIYVVRGQIAENRSTCAVPIIHKAGDVATEAGQLTHWWRNTSSQTVVLISADVLPPAGPPAEGTM